MSEPVLHVRRLRACVEAWPDCREGEYNPYCCRFPKSCSCDIYDPERVKDEDLEPMPERGEPSVTNAATERSTVSCQDGCGAFDQPETLDEYKAACEHWKDHESSWGGCSHGR